MPKKSLPISDVKKPGHSVPPASSRPIVVTDRPVLPSDPMMVAAAEAAPQEIADTEASATPPSAPDVSRTAKTIQPVHTTDGAPQEPEAEAPAEPVEEKPGAQAHKPADADVAPAADETKDEPKPAAPTGKTEDDGDQGTILNATTVKADDAEAAKAAEAAQQRAEQMQKLIDSRQFFLPVNAVQQKRSQHTSLWLTLLVIVLAAILIDLMLDANVIVLLTKLPHTHFFAPHPHF